MKTVCFAILFSIFPVLATSQTPEQVWIPAKDAGFRGRIIEIKLEAWLYKPAGNGPFPVLVLNHGSTGNGSIPEKLSFKPDYLAKDWVGAGFVVLVPQRRGRGASEGRYAETEMSCDHGDSWAAVQNGMQDFDAVIAYLKSQPYADMKNLFLGGISRGGFLSTVYPAHRSELEVRAVLNLVGGWNNDRCPHEFNAPVLKEAGSRTKVPNFWYYGSGDANYTDDSIRSYEKVFREAGGNVVRFELFKGLADGHRVHHNQHLWEKETIKRFRGYIAGSRADKSKE